MSDSIPELEGWITATDAADKLKLTRQSVNKKIHAGDFEKVRTLGKQYVLWREEVEAMVQTRAGQKEDAQPEG